MTHYECMHVMGTVGVSIGDAGGGSERRVTVEKCIPPQKRIRQLVAAEGSRAYAGVAFGASLGGTGYRIF